MESAFEFDENKIKHRATLSIFVQLLLKARERKIYLEDTLFYCNFSPAEKFTN